MNGRVDSVERSGPFIRTYTGGKFYFNDVRPEDINIEDIAHALSLNSRFTGHCKRHLSVAEHSLNVSTALAGQSCELAGLLHDSSEAFLSDVARPLKHSEQFRPYRELEAQIEKVIEARFGFSGFDHAAVKSADNLMLGVEAFVLMGVRPGEEWDWALLPAMKHPLWEDMKWSLEHPPKDVKQDFLDYFYFLNGEKKAA